MKINSSIFKAYDIRGVYPSEINEEAAYLIGRAFIEFLSRGRKRKLKIAVGRDNRSSSRPLFRGLIKGIRDEGADVIDVGLSTTPMLYFGVAHYKLDGGINITASHNPSQYNGFKLVGGKSVPISGAGGLPEIQAIISKINAPGAVLGALKRKEILDDYLKFNFKEVDLSEIKPFKLVIDTANAVGIIPAREFFKKIPGKSHFLFPELDGNFPNHLPDPLKKENLRWLQEDVIKREADLGIAFDGDADRVIFIDESGEIIQPDFITGLLSSLLLKKKRGGKILYDVRSSNIVRETIGKCGGIPLMSRIGHSFIKERMRKENIVFAGEFSGHYYFKKHFFCESPFFAILYILEAMSAENKKMSELLKPFRRYFHSGELNFEVGDKQKKLRELKNRYSGGKILGIDGLRIDFPDWWFLVRPSQTEPLLRLVLEAKTRKLMEKKKKELTALINF